MQYSLMKIKQSKGFSLLELLLVVAVGAILLLAGLAVYRNVTDNSKVNESLRILNVTKQETQKLFQGEGNYPAQALNDVLVDSNAFPTSALNGNQPRHPYNGDITVTGIGRTFSILFADVPEASCIKIGQAFAAEDADFVSLQIGGNTLDAGVDGVFGALELQNACDGDIDMRWEFF
jgi:prepilin-type N-terminal cleavage/methylation domain-containing protein